MHVKKWQSRKPEEKWNISKRKTNIIERFRSETWLLLGIPIQGGSNINDENNARTILKKIVWEDFLWKLYAAVTACIIDHHHNQALIERF